MGMSGCHWTIVNMMTALINMYFQKCIGIIWKCLLSFSFFYMSILFSHFHTIQHEYIWTCHAQINKNMGEMENMFFGGCPILSITVGHGHRLVSTQSLGKYGDKIHEVIRFAKD